MRPHTKYSEAESTSSTPTLTGDGFGTATVEEDADENHRSAPSEPDRLAKNALASTLTQAAVEAGLPLEPNSWAKAGSTGRNKAPLSVSRKQRVQPRRFQSFSSRAYVRELLEAIELRLACCHASAKDDVVFAVFSPHGAPHHIIPRSTFREEWRE